jgi:putative ABC transport system permease protein
MNAFAVVGLALTALARNRSRSLLTMLGIIIGVTAVIVTVAIGVGAREFVAQQISGLGSNLLIVLPGSITQSGVRTGSGGASTLTVNDGLAIAKLDGVASVSPVASLRTQVVAGGNNWQTTITGVASTYTFIRNWPLASGTFISQSDTQTTAKTAVLGQTVINNLFPDGSSPLGKTILIKNVPFTVIGTLSAKGQSGMGQDQDDTVLIPYTSAMQRLTGLTTVSILMISAATAEGSTLVQRRITALLYQRHRIVGSLPADFSVRNLQDIAATATATAAALEALLAGVAAISLIVGGIGIMNIMLVSVTERTHEIGLRMAVGARSRVILEQFLTESIVLSVLGAFIGIALGTLGAWLLALITKWPVSVPLDSVLLAVLFSAAVGISFGYYPARKAAGLNPIDALHAE